jgi:hypothetical protein
MANGDPWSLIDIRGEHPTAAALLIKCLGNTPADLQTCVVKVSNQ